LNQDLLLFSLYQRFPNGFSRTRGVLNKSAVARNVIVKGESLCVLGCISVLFSNEPNFMNIWKFCYSKKDYPTTLTNLAI